MDSQSMRWTTENVLQLINNQYISINTTERRRNNEIIGSFLDRMISAMNRLDSLFEALFQRPYYGGSYYDDLKVGSADEYDLDLLLNIPKKCEVTKSKTCDCISLESSNKPGFLWFKVKHGHCIGLNRFILDGYMQTDLVLNWLKGLITKALSSFRDPNIFAHTIKTPAFYSESGPAITLNLFSAFGVINVDLVPAFLQSQWPASPYRPNPSNDKTDFFLVPKQAIEMPSSKRYWRLSFQDQERELINGKQRLKPALRLLKKMRNNLQHDSISSYALKTIVLWEVHVYDWNRPLSEVFMMLLEKYEQSLEQRKIPYYWNKKNNLLESLNESTLANHHNEIRRKLLKLKSNYNSNPLEVAKVILKEGTREYDDLLLEYNRRNAGRYQPSDDDGGSLGGNGDQAQANAGMGTWGAALLGIGAVAVAGLAIFGSLARNRND